MTYEFNHVRKAWEMGKKYVYQLDFTLNEIIVTEEVKDYVVEETPIPLS